MSEFNELVAKHHDMIIQHVCYEAGCEALFGTATLPSLVAAVVEKGTEKILKETTWMFRCDTTKGFDEWVRQKVKWEELPKYVSRQAYLDGFDRQLHALFMKEKKEEKADDQKTDIK